MTYGEAAEALLVYPVIDGYARIDAGFVSDVVKMVKDLEKDNERYLNHISMLQEKIRNGSEWISVEDRLPEGGLVLCTDGEYCFVDKIPDMEDVREDGVTHWMPLPEPPKPKEPTFKDVFLKAFPKASCDDVSCCMVFTEQFIYDSCDENCAACWNQPYFEKEGKKRND